MRYYDTPPFMQRNHIQIPTGKCFIDATFKMKKGETADDHKISAEHFFEARLSLSHRLQSLFSKMLLHGPVPHQFQSGTIIPIVKDCHGDQGDMNNYHGITIAPIISKIFEYTL